MGLNDTSVLVEKYINTAYDQVKAVYDNLDDVLLVADDIVAVVNVAALGSVSQIVADLAIFVNTPPIGIKAPVVVSTTADITLANEQTINTVAVVALDRVLVRSQTDTTENGIYDVVDAGAWVRSADWNATVDVNSGILVMDGFTEILYKASFTGIYTPDTTALTFSPSDTTFTTIISTSNTTVSTSGSTGAITSAGGIGALLDMVTGETFKPLGDISAGDLAAFGYTAADGAILTGQGSTNDVTFKNDTNAIVARIPTGTTNFAITSNLSIGTSLTIATFIDIGELTSVTAPGAGRSKYWSKDDAPTIPMFTDDTDVDYGILISDIPLKIKIIEIGDWDMSDATGTGSVNIPHGLTHTDIRSISAIIRIDTDIQYFEFSIDAGDGGAHNIRADNTNITLTRNTTGVFDGPNFDNTSFNRGWITIYYV